MIGPAKCVTCAFWLEGNLTTRDGMVSLGSCRRNAPIIFIGPEAKPMTRWPLTKENDACGEHSTLTEALIDEEMEG